MNKQIMSSLWVGIFCLALYTSGFGIAESSAEVGGAPFHCPKEHVYIHCGELHDNLDYYGYPKAAYGHHITVEGPHTEKYLDACGKGKIKRKWKIKYHYDWYWCEQTIHIKDPYGSKAFDGHHDVHWPKDYHMKDCQGDAHPDQMPYGHNWPEFDHHGCSKLGLHFEDKELPYGSHHSYQSGYGHYEKPCKVIKRTWTLIDWCQYEDNHYGGYGYKRKGKWTHVQHIYVYDDVAPEITSCPEDILADGGDCDGQKVYVEIPKVSATDDCGHVYYAYSRKHLGDGETYSHYGGSTFKSGNNASGYYHPGKTKVTFKAFDICGNTTECDIIVDVVAEDNKPPTVVAISSITASLMMMDTNEGMVEIWPHEFNSSSYDNCTATENLKFSLEPSVFTCENYGSNEVKFIVEDEAGNSDYALVEVIIQAHGFECMGGKLNGQVITADGLGVEGVEVTVMDGMMKMTDKDGSFAFTDIPLGRDLHVTPYKNTDARQGLDMFDYLLLSMHVDGLREIADPKKLFAADIDGNQVIDYLDVLALQKLVLGIDQVIHGNTAWKFLPTDFEFPDTINPLKAEIPQFIDLTPFNGGDQKLEFEAIKIGDLGKPRRLIQKPGDKSSEEEIIVQNILIKAGEVMTVPLIFAEDGEANTISFTLDVDPDKMEILDVYQHEISVKGQLETIDPDGRGHVLSTSWTSIKGEEYRANDVFMTLVVKARQSHMLHQSLSLSGDYAIAHLSSFAADIEKRVKLSFREGTGKIASLLQNNPNPFTDFTNIDFYLPEDGNARLSIKDIHGSEIHRIEGFYKKGDHSLSLSRASLNDAHGILLYELQTGSRRLVRKMIVLD